MSAKYSRNEPFNKMQIKDGWIVIMRKDGSIKSRIEPYKPKVKKQMATRRNHFDLGQNLAHGQMPMFMTGKEIQTHLNPYVGDIRESSHREGEYEGNHELWERKYEEATSHQDFDGAEHDEKFDSLAHDIAHQGFKNPVVPVNFKEHEVLGAHHRIAVGAEEHPNHLFPVVHHDNIHEAREHLKEAY